MENFKKNVTTTEDIEVYNNRKNVGETEIIKTGNIIKIGQIEYIAIVCGDVNEDGKASLTDLVQIKQHLIGKEELKEEKGIAADIDVSEKVSSTDILNLKRLIVRIIEERQIYENEYTNEEYVYKKNRLTEKVTIVKLANNKKSGVLQIPNKIDGAEVTKIEDFLGENKRITKVTIPAKIDNISNVAFSGMENLKAIEVNKLNEKYSSNEGILYNKEGTSLLGYPRGKAEAEYKIEEKVKEIGEYAFYKNNKVEKIYISDSIEKVSKTAFEEIKGQVYVTENSKAKSILTRNGIAYKIDRAPKVTKLTYNIGTNQAVNLTIEATDEEGIVEWSITAKGNSEENWKKISSTKSLRTTYNEIKQNGTYVLKVKDIAGNIGSKEVTITELDESKPQVTSMKIISPPSGEYKPGQKITIRVEFSEKVKGTAPILKLKIGNEIGTGKMISSNVTGNTKYIEYTYTSREEQFGNVEIYSYSGGNLTDLNGNKLIITKLANNGNNITIISPIPNLGGIRTGSFTSSIGRNTKYWIYIPDISLVKNYNNIPVVLNLHMSGAGNLEFFNEYSLPGYIKSKQLTPKAIVIAPVCYNETRREEYDTVSMIELIESIPATYNNIITLNRSKISIAGHSQGARHALRLAKANPNYFSACVLFSWVENKTDRHDMQDDPMPTCQTKFVYEDRSGARYNLNIATKLSQKYSNITVETVANTAHETVVIGFKTNNILDWMLAQTR